MKLPNNDIRKALFDLLSPLLETYSGFNKQIKTPCYLIRDVQNIQDNCKGIEGSITEITIESIDDFTSSMSWSVVDENSSLMIDLLTSNTLQLDQSLSINMTLINTLELPEPLGTGKTRLRRINRFRILTQEL